MTSTNLTLTAALAAAARGWPVFPLRPNDKRPAKPDHTAERCDRTDPRCRTGHQGFEPRATTDPDRIRRGWTRAFNVGIATGPAGLVVVDLDVPKPGQEAAPAGWQMDGVHTGEDVLAVLADRAGESLADLYDTYTVRTGRGGRHLYFAGPAGARLGNSGGKLGWLVDTRAHGGYVVGAGSVVAGRPYTVAYDAPVAPLAAWLFQQLVPAPLPAQRPVTVPLTPDRRGSYLRTAITAELGRVTGAPDHHNDALYRASIALGQLVAGGALPAESTAQALEHAGVSAGLVPAAARRTIASGFRAGAHRPRTVAA